MPSNQSMSDCIPISLVKYTYVKHQIEGHSRVSFPSNPYPSNMYTLVQNMLLYEFYTDVSTDIMLFPSQVVITTNYRTPNDYVFP